MTCWLINIERMMESPLCHHNCKNWFKKESGWRWRLNEVHTIYIILSILPQITIIAHLHYSRCSLKFVGNPKFNTHSIFSVIIHGYTQKGENLSHSMCTCSAEVEQGNALLSNFSCHSVDQSVFQGILSGFCIFVLFIGYFAV